MAQADRERQNSGDQTYVRFVPQEADTREAVVEEVGTSLRLIECDDGADRHLPDDAQSAAFAAWTLARKNIWTKWQHLTDPKDLQPKVRKLNREVDVFLAEHPPTIASDQETALPRSRRF